MKSFLYSCVCALVLCFFLQTSSYAGCTAQEGLIAYRGTLSAEDARTLRVIHMDAENVVNGRADTWTANLINSSSHISVEIINIGGEWKFNDRYTANRAYDTSRTLDIFSWIDSDRLMQLTLEPDSNTTISSRFRGKVLSTFVTRQLSLDAVMMNGKVTWQVSYPSKLYYDAGTGSYLWDGGGFYIDAVTGKCIGVLMLTSGGGTDVPAEEYSTKWDIVPNPAEETITIAGVQSTAATTIQIFSMTGEIVQTTTITSEEPFLNIRALPSGLYLLHYGRQRKLFVVVR